MHYRSQCGCGVDHSLQLSDNGKIPDRTYIEQLLNSIYKGDKPDLKSLYGYVYKQLSEHIIQGFGADFTDLKYDTPDWEKLSQLQYNAGVFAAFKNHSQIREITALLIADDGTRRKWQDFKEKALQIDETYNVRWLRAEYNHAHAVARSAREWVDVQRTAHLYPNLQYVAVNDSRTRAQHRRWNGIVLPIAHPFWDTHFPPNDWGCRCKTRRTDKPVDTKDIDVQKPVPNKPGFNINFGKQGKVFADDHPYYNVRNYKKIAKYAKNALFKYKRLEMVQLARKIKPLKANGIDGPVYVGSDGIRKMFDRNKRDMNHWFDTVHLLYDIENWLPKLQFKFYKKEDGINIFGIYKSILKVNGVAYEVGVRKTINSNNFYYIYRLKKQ